MISQTVLTIAIIGLLKIWNLLAKFPNEVSITGRARKIL